MNITPLAKRLAEENNLDLNLVVGTGENGRIMGRDVLQKLADYMNGVLPEPIYTIDLGDIS